MNIPEKINRFNMYVDKVEENSKVSGVTDEVTLPEFENMSETLSLGGMGGEVDSPSPGQYKSTQIEIPFSNISEDSLNAAADDSKSIILKAAQEQLDTETLSKSYIGRTITVKGMTKKVNYGKLKKGGYGNPSITKEVIYYKDQVGDTVITEIDKFNGKAIVNGVNLMADIDNLI